MFSADDAAPVPTPPQVVLVGPDEAGEHALQPAVGSMEWYAQRNAVINEAEWIRPHVSASAPKPIPYVIPDESSSDGDIGATIIEEEGSIDLEAESAGEYCDSDECVTPRPSEDEREEYEGVTPPATEEVRIPTQEQDFDDGEDAAHDDPDREYQRLIAEGVWLEYLEDHRNDD